VHIGLLIFSASFLVKCVQASRFPRGLNSTRLTAAIAATDVITVGDFPVTVYDPAPAPTGTQTLPLIFHVVQSVSRVYLPVVFK
jgi:hypothetical protein